MISGTFPSASGLLPGEVTPNELQQVRITQLDRRVWCDDDGRTFA